MVARSTREKILEMLANTPCCVGSIAEVFNISRVAVHKHLEKLREEGLVRCNTVPSEGRGRPKQVFELTPNRDNVYNILCGSLLDAVRSQYGDDGVTCILSQHKRNLFTALTAKVQYLPPLERLKELKTLLDDMGYQPQLELQGDTVLLIQNHCPAKDVAVQNSELCKCEHNSYQDLVGLPIHAETTIAQGATSCVYKIKLD